jgi:alkyl sulfatase BDS1-like metallo-beta-lactamase superfamily hydrolase
MATIEQCREALQRLASRLGGVESDTARKHAPDRTLSCRLPDLAVTFTGRLEDGQLVDITEASSPRADVRLTVHSDDLIKLVDGRLAVLPAWSSGKLKIEAGIRDLLRIKSLF